MRRALIVGIDDYPVGPLNGCVRDAIDLERVLSRHADGSSNFSCRLITGPPQPITRASFRQELITLLRSSADIAYLHFSGHGLVTETGGVLLTQDTVKYDEGVSMHDILTLVNSSPVADIVMTLDCCHSGAFGEVPAFPGTSALLREGVSITAACRRDEHASERGGRGMMTEFVVDALEGGAASVVGDVSASSIYSHLDAAFGPWDQRPMFKAHVSRLVSLRSCEPKLSLSTLLSLSQHFAHDGTAILSASAGISDGVRRLKLFAELRNAGLLEVGDSDIQHLNALGRYYRRLSVEGKI